MDGEIKEVDDGYVICATCGNQVLQELAAEKKGGGYLCKECYEKYEENQ